MRSLMERMNELHGEILSLLERASDETRSKATDMHDKWMPLTPYNTDDVVRHEDKLYRCLQSHTSEDTWFPPQAPSLWARIMYREGIRVIPETLSPADAFNAGELGWWGDTLYKSKINNNVWTPDQYPAGWQEVENVSVLA